MFLWTPIQSLTTLLSSVSDGRLVWTYKHAENQRLKSIAMETECLSEQLERKKCLSDLFPSAIKDYWDYYSSFTYSYYILICHSNIFIIAYKAYEKKLFGIIQHASKSQENGIQEESSRVGHTSSSHTHHHHHHTHPHVPVSPGLVVCC